MQTELSPELINHPEGIEVKRLLSNCVHCGFCTATCPTYQLLGDELDGPRGRIYLIKQMAEGKKATTKTREHLDRCLTCRNCESTCPSGVQYGHLLDIGRKWAEEQTDARPVKERAVRWLLKEFVSRAELFTPAMTVGRLVKPLLPKVLKKKIPDLNPSSSKNYSVKDISPTQTMLMLNGCVQPGMFPQINAATQRVFRALGVQIIAPTQVGCCGALKFHLNDQESAKAQMKNNIDSWWPHIEHDKVTAIIMNASGCGVAVKDYGYILRDDPKYAEKAKLVSLLTKDVSELLLDFQSLIIERIGATHDRNLVYHPPCTLQHGQKISGKVENLLTSLGVKVQLCADSHICCGSAGTYSILQASLSDQLREQKLNHLLNACESSGASEIVSGNVGCISQLQQDQVPVKHWIEVLDDLFYTSLKH